MQTIQTKALVDALSLVRPAVANREVLENTNCFAFLGDRICAYNDNIAISVPFKTDFVAVVEAKPFYAFMTKTTEETLEIGFPEDGETTLLIKAKRATAKLPVREAKDLFVQGVVGVAEGHKKLPKNFSEAVRSVLFCCSNDASLPALCCVNVGDADVESTDRYRACRKDLSKASGLSLLIPANAAGLLVEYVPNAYAEMEGWGSFLNEAGVEFCCRLVEGDFPDLDRVMFDEGIDIRLPEALEATLDKARVFMSVESELEERVRITIDAKRITVETDKGVTKGGASFCERLPCKQEGLGEEDKYEFAIRPKHLLEGLSCGRILSLAKESTLISFRGEGFVHVMQTMV